MCGGLCACAQPVSQYTNEKLRYDDNMILNATKQVSNLSLSLSLSLIVVLLSSFFHSL